MKSFFERIDVLMLSMRTDRYRETQWRRVGSDVVVAEELCDHREDPGERVNLAPERPAEVKGLEGLMKAGWRGAVPDEALQRGPGRFARTHGPLRPVGERVLQEFLKCGLVEHGFARLWCSQCRRSMLVAFSCRGRSFCPSCEKKKQLLWAEWLSGELLAPVSHRHVVLTIPRLLRSLFRRRRELLTELARARAEATVELVRRQAGVDLRPGLVVSLATAGDLLQWHPHLHILASDGGFAAGGAFVGLAQWDATLLMSLFRGRLLARLLDRHAISQELVPTLLAHLGTPHRKDLPGGSARLLPLRPEDADHRLPHRHLRHPAHPRPPRTEPTRGGTAPAPQRAPPRRRAGGRLGRAGKLG
jgi:hypothetical protein